MTGGVFICSGVRAGGKPPRSEHLGKILTINRTDSTLSIRNKQDAASPGDFREKTEIGEPKVSDKREKKSVLPPILMSDILLISCCAASTALFAVALIVPVGEGVRTFLFLASIILVLYDLLFDAVMKLWNGKMVDC